MKPLRLLSLDGGGVRGLSTIIILKEIMRGVSKDAGQNIEPWQHFDLIGGTSTGGLLAIMLGRLRLTLDQCQTAYLKLSERIFDPKRNKMNVAGKSKDFLQANGRFDADELKEAIKEIIADPGGLNVEQLLLDPYSACKVFVCAARTGNASCAILRSYESDLPMLLSEQCKIWEACRATSAATTFFDPVKIGPFDQEFADGAIIYNNPIDLVHHEAETLWPQRISEAIFVSIGTGSAPGAAFQGNIKHIVEAMKKIVTQTERTADDFFHAHSRMIQESRYFRFNVYHGLADVGLEEYKQKAKIADATQTYLLKGETLQKTRACVARLCGADTSKFELENEFLQAIDFQEMNHRFDEIELPYQKSFNWIFGTSGPGFTNWLRGDKGIYWVSGKAGSGKSTMMKYMYGHDWTRQLLGKRLGLAVVVQFFFHDRGSDLQKSFSGLLRALLYQILLSFPALRKFAIQVTQDLYNRDLQDWSETRLKKVLKLIKEQHDTHGQVCVFADGLDEFNGEDSAIAEFFKELTSHRAGQGLLIRACLAGRPHNAFQDAFEGLPGMQIHQWTVGDIQRYVEHRFSGSLRFRTSTREVQEELVKSVVGRASGVFLWVRLVLNVLLQALEDGDKLQELQEKLDALPDDLDQLYLRMLQRVNDGLKKDPRTRQRKLAEIAQLFLIVDSAKAPLSLSRLFCVIDEDIDPKFSFLETFTPLPQHRSLTNLHDLDVLHRRLKARCGGILEVQVRHKIQRSEISSCVDQELPYLAGLTATLELGHVQYLHQTAKEYMGRLHTWEHAFAIQDPKPRININRQLMTTTLRTLKAARSEILPRSEDSSPVLRPSTSFSAPGVLERKLGVVPVHWELVDDCIYYAQQEQSLTKLSSIDLLDKLDAIVTEVFQPVTHMEDVHWAAAFSLHKHKKSIPFSDVMHDTFVSLAAEAGLGRYVKQAIRRDECLASKLGRPLIHFAIPGRGSRRIWDTDLIEFLLQEGGARHEDTFEGMTAWQSFLTEMKRCKEFRFRSASDFWSEKEPPRQVYRRENYLRAVKAFVNQGADVNVMWEGHPYLPLRVFLWSCGESVGDSLNQELHPLMLDIVLMMVKRGAHVHTEHQALVNQILTTALCRNALSYRGEACQHLDLDLVGLKAKVEPEL